MRYLLILCLLAASGFASAQQSQTTTPASPEKPKVYNFVEQMPSPGYDMLNYLSQNIKYPKAAIKNNVQGRVMVQFVVNEDGSISDAKVVKGIGGGCDEEALRIVNTMPNWKPGKQNGKPVKVLYTQPMNFRLE